MIENGVSHNAFSFEWFPPQIINGDIKEFSIYIKFINYSYHNPSDCKINFTTEYKLSVKAEADRNYTFYDAVPAADYSIQVSVVNSGEYMSNYSKTIFCQTLSGLKI